jgi:hypothetical protein
MEVIIRALILGAFATVAIDVWAAFSNRVLKFPRTNWAMVGRWLGHIPNGEFIHNPIDSSPPIKNELLAGWVFHYVIGVTYALLYVILVLTKLENVPTLFSAWIFGLVTILSPWFVIQPGLGLGFCAVKAPQANLVRLQNIIIHSIFGIALYYGWVGTNLFL